MLRPIPACRRAPSISISVHSKAILPRTCRLPHGRRSSCFQHSSSSNSSSSSTTHNTQSQAPVTDPSSSDSYDTPSEPVHSTGSSGTAVSTGKIPSPPANASAAVMEALSPSQDAEATWGTSTPETDEDWQGSKPFTLKDVDWGLTGLLGIILVLSFAAYRVLHHFRIYQHSHRPRAHTITQMVEHQRSSSASQPSSSSTTSNIPDSTSSAVPAAAAAAAPGSTTTSSSKPSKPVRSKARQDKAATKSSKSNSKDAAAPPLAETEGEGQTSAATTAAGPLAVPGTPGPLPTGNAGVFELPQQSGLPGLPQPSPLDAGFSSSLAPPWSGSDLGQLDLAPLSLSDSALKPPELPSIQVEPPAKAVKQSEVDALPQDPSLPSLRERAHIAMRASGAAMEAAQRASAYSAAASSAASRAAEAAEQAAAAAAAVQSALEVAAEEAMAEAVKRMNKAVEMVADAESRAAAAAAMATAYQDISDGQAAAAAAAADLPAMPVRSAQQGHIANLQKVLHEQMFSAGGVLADWAASIWSAIVGALAFVQAAAAAAVAKVAAAAASVSKGF